MCSIITQDKSYMGLRLTQCRGLVFLVPLFSLENRRHIWSSLPPRRWNTLNQVSLCGFTALLLSLGWAGIQTVLPWVLPFQCGLSSQPSPDESPQWPLQGSSDHHSDRIATANNNPPEVDSSAKLIIWLIANIRPWTHHVWSLKRQTVIISVLLSAPPPPRLLLTIELPSSFSFFFHLSFHFYAFFFLALPPCTPASISAGPSFTHALEVELTALTSQLSLCLRTPPSLSCPCLPCLSTPTFPPSFIFLAAHTCMHAILTYVSHVFQLFFTFIFWSISTVSLF